jgi:hypothetical protein
MINMKKPEVKFVQDDANHCWLRIQEYGDGKEWQFYILLSDDDLVEILEQLYHFMENKR